MKSHALFEHWNPALSGFSTGCGRSERTAEPESRSHGSIRDLVTNAELSWEIVRRREPSSPDAMHCPPILGRSSSRWHLPGRRSSDHTAWKCLYQISRHNACAACGRELASTASAVQPRCALASSRAELDCGFVAAPTYPRADAQSDAAAAAFHVLTAFQSVHPLWLCAVCPGCCRRNLAKSRANAWLTLAPQQQPTTTASRETGWAWSISNVAWRRRSGLAAWQLD